MILLLWTLAWLGATQPADPPAPPPADEPPTLSVRGADLDLLSTVRAIGTRVESLRGQRFERPPIAVRAPHEMLRVAAEIRALNVLERRRLAARGRAWADLGLGEARAPAAVYRALAGDLAGIGYDAAGHRLLVAPDRLTEADFAPDSGDAAPATVLMMTGVRVDEPLVVHLLMHVRQGERSGRDSLAVTTDELLARSAWAEGEANLVAIRHLFAGMGLADEVLEQQLDPATVLDGRLVPPALDELDGVEGQMVRFVYREGFAAAVRAYRAGGWPALDNAMASRTRTADLLHPERAPLPAAVFGAPRLSPAVEGVTVVDEDSLGEQGIFTLISTQTGKDNLALQAADGWVGDRLYRWEGADPEAGLTLWVTRWRDAAAAADFDYAVLRTLEARLPGRPPITLEGGERAVQTASRVYRLRRSGAEVRLQIAARALDELSHPAPG